MGMSHILVGRPCSALPSIADVQSACLLIRTLAQELADCTTNPPPGVTVALKDESNIFAWTAKLQGPPSSPYEGGTFSLDITLPRDYPFKVPQVRFMTRIYHPNVTNDEQGSVCLSILKPENWKPATKITHVLSSILDLLREPNPDDPLEARIADEFRSQRDEFNKNAKHYVERYAKA